MRELAQREGLFGPIRVLERKSDGARLYCIKNSVQTMMLPDGVSAFGYVHAAKLLLASAKSVLIIGGAGGSLATMMARRGCRVTVVDIDPVAEELARQFFDLPANVEWLTTEPLSFIADLRRRFDAVVVDACDAEGLARPFNEPHVLAAIAERACPTGSLVLNLVHEDGAPPWGPVLATRLAARGLCATLYRSEEGWEGNELLHVSVSRAPSILDLGDLLDRPAEVRTYLSSLRSHTPLSALPMAEGVGFEPTVDLHPRRFSRPVP